MKQQEMRELLEEQLYYAQTIRAVQAQFLAESDREAETKRHFRQQADAAWKQLNAIHRRLIEAIRQNEVTQED